jgi:starch synthase
VPVYLRTLYGVASVARRLAVGVHDSQPRVSGLFTPDWLPRLDLGWELFTVDRLEYWDRISFLKGGINAADSSRRSARATPKRSRRRRRVRLRRHPRARAPIWSASSTASTVASGIRRTIAFCRAVRRRRSRGQARGEAALLRRYGCGRRAAAMKRPLVGMVSRMVDQKGFDLIAALAGELSRLDARSWCSAPARRATRTCGRRWRRSIRIASPR